MTDDEIEVGRVTITRVLAGNGNESVRVDVKPDGFSNLETLVMLALANDWVLDNFNNGEDSDE